MNADSSAAATQIILYKAASGDLSQKNEFPCAFNLRVKE